jgi:hypothetical protein
MHGSENWTMMLAHSKIMEIEENAIMRYVSQRPMSNIYKYRYMTTVMHLQYV